MALGPLEPTLQPTDGSNHMPTPSSQDYKGAGFLGPLHGPGGQQATRETGRMANPADPRWAEKRDQGRQQAAIEEQAQER